MNNSKLKKKILVVDDDIDILEGLRGRLKHLGYETVTAETGADAIYVLKKESPDVVLLDLALPDKSGLDVLKEIVTLESSFSLQHNQDNDTASYPPVIMLTANGTLESAVEAMKIGAIDFLKKPFEMDHLAVVLEKALERKALIQEVCQLRKEVASQYGTMIGTSEKIQAVCEVAQKAAQSNITVLLLGETGTGKELFARWIHKWSPRRNHSFSVVNCAALNETLLESELFGHEKGAFTGALKRHYGRIESAKGGTVFLDEIGDMPLPLQSRLLRALQNHEIQRVGGTGSIDVDVRFIAATNRDLDKEVQAGSFRKDLFFRLNMSITLPPLRERQDDIIRLAEHFLRCHNQNKDHPSVTLDEEAISALLHYHWPGNVREIDNVLQRALILKSGHIITSADLHLRKQFSEDRMDNKERETSVEYRSAVDHFKRGLVLGALHRNNGNKTKAAGELRIERTYLNKMIKTLGIHLV